jgi:ferrous iron transport protein A
MTLSTEDWPPAVALDTVATPPGVALQSLDTLPPRVPANVMRVGAPADQPGWADWLAQIGFLPGERVQVLTRTVPGGDPLVVRVGDSTFALRRAEAACVQVQIDREATSS